MPTFTPEELRNHIESKLSMSLKEKVERIYGDMSFDYAVPSRWLRHISEVTEIPKWKVSRMFIWIYPEGNIIGEPGPVSEEACALLQTYYERIENQRNTTETNDEDN